MEYSTSDHVIFNTNFPNSGRRRNSKSCHVLVHFFLATAMSYYNISPISMWHNWNDPLRTGWHKYIPCHIEAFPKLDLPPIRCAFPTTTPIHFLHLLPIGQHQVASLPPYSLYLPQSNLLLESNPRTGQFWINTTARFMLQAYSLLCKACISGKATDWHEVAAYVNLGSVTPKFFPAICTVTMAAANAEVGCIIESIDMRTEIRTYAVLQAVLAATTYYAYFEASILGSDSSGT